MQSAITLKLGSLALVSRTADVDLKPHDWAMIDTATIWSAAGHKDQSRQLLRDVEDAHGVTNADRRFAKLSGQGLLIVPGPVSGSVRLGGPALFVDDGRSERVLVTSDVWDHPESGEAMRTCSFLDQAGEEFDVKAANLSPCDDLFRALPLAPEALETGKWAGVPRDAEPFRARPVSKAPIMDKFDRVAPIKPEDVRLDIGRMTAGQRERLRSAEAKLANAERRKTFRQHLDDKGRVTGYGRMTPAERAERADYRAEMDRLQRETLSANDRAEVSRGRVETLALEEMRGGAMLLHSDGRLTRKNGLDTLLASGGITGPEHVAGEKYADIFSAAKSGEIRIANWEGSGGGSAPDPDGERLRRLKELAAKKALTDIERFIVQTVSHKRALWAVRLVAGQGKLIAHVSTSGGNRATNTRALQMALQALADNWGLQ